ncbi:LysR family transcriptional regulator [Roseovarius nubinhibens]|uniref:Transcriptional regulator, LysR family protein n=1 Tax=Roseovarius nubinhibens (strain ATCC BAA-591 / DSM 15170 / ISM) TaxID=89187 RepID=A3SNI1_ROSNI|nr:LysR family transcriptional regulator [Roseovarius nubinhibens]EAP76021.1 transcriptional regulator, LysR family protein [Roseovarius nubinhibens ISM]
MPRLSRRHLPSLGAFATFEVAAKHLSFTAAARELNVTQAAVSQQIRALETALDTSLFRRSPGGLELSPAGATLLGAVGDGLDRLTEAIATLSAPPQVDQPITIAATIGVASHWITALTRAYRESHPDTCFTILASDEDDRLSRAAGVDIALICGNDRSRAGDELYYLFPEMVQPVCSPEFLAQHGPFDDAETLTHQPLLDLHDSHWQSRAINWQPLTWVSWFNSLGITHVPRPAPLSTNCNPILIDAARRGEGVILGWRHIVAEDLARGTLVPAHPHVLRVERANFLQVNDHARDRPDLRPFVDYVLDQSRSIAAA